MTRSMKTVWLCLNRGRCRVITHDSVDWCRLYIAVRGNVKMGSQWLRPFANAGGKVAAICAHGRFHARIIIILSKLFF